MPEIRAIVLGNCQSRPFAAHLRALGLNSVDCVPVSQMKPAAMPRITEKIHSSDIVFMQEIGSSPFTAAQLRDRGKNVQVFPRIVFSGFHPDQIYVRSESGSVLETPLGSYHSRIIASAFLLKIRPDRVPSLFNSYTYSLLGYFNAYAASVKHLKAEMDRAGFDLAPFLQEWMSAGSFMHSINHPKRHVIEMLSRAALAKVGIEATGTTENIVDGLAKASCWPVYPEIAQHLHVDGSLTFRRGVRRTPKGESRDIDLPTFVDVCYDLYGNFPPDPLLNPTLSNTAEILSQAGLR